MYLAKMFEDGRILITSPFPSIAEARAEGKRLWQTVNFDVIQLRDDDQQIRDRVYEAVRYVGKGE